MPGTVSRVRQAGGPRIPADLVPDGRYASGVIPSRFFQRRASVPGGRVAIWPIMGLGIYRAQLERLTAFSAIAAIAAIKLLLILAFGPLLQPDSSGYITFAETMLSDSALWLVDRPSAGGEDSYRITG